MPFKAVTEKIVIAIILLSSSIPVFSESRILNFKIGMMDPDRKKVVETVLALADSAQANINRGNYNGLWNFVNQLGMIALEKEEVYAQFFHTYFKGNYYFFVRDYDKCNFEFESALNMAIKMNDKPALALIYDDLGTFTLDYETDYNKSLRYFFRSLTASQLSENPYQEALVLAHIAVTYYMKASTDGMKYAKLCLDKGLEIDDDITIYLGAYYSGCFALMKKEYNEAKRLLEIAIERNHECNIDTKTATYSLYASALYHLGHKQEAERYIDEAISSISPESTFSTILAYKVIGEIYKDEAPSIALDYEMKALETSEKKNSYYFRETIYKNISEIYENLQLTADALEYYKKYTEYKLQSLNIQQENLVTEIQVKYDTNKALLDAAKAEEKLIQREKNITQITAILLLSFITMIYFLISYIRKNRLYKSLAKNLYEKQTIKYNTSSLNNEKGNNLFNEIQNLLKDPKILCDRELSLDNLARLLNSNRTYVSQAINEKTTQTFNAYINSLRIERAIQLLSDDNFNSPMKSLAAELGYSSISTFYKAFNDITQMSPVVYRKEAMKMTKNKNIAES